MRGKSKQPSGKRVLKIDAEHMRVFVAIGQSHTLTEAASTLQVPLFAVSRVLKRIETNAKLSLVRRDASGLEMTGAGRDYFKACLNVLEAQQGVVDVLAQHREEPEGTLAISTPIPFAVHVLSSILPKFHQLYPNLKVDLNLYCSDWDKPPKAMHDIVLKVRSPRDSAHHMMVFPEIRQGIFASRKYLAKRKAPTHPSDLETHVCVGLSREHGSSTWNLTNKAEHMAISPRFAIVAPDMEIMTRLAVEEAGIAMLPLWRAHPEVQAGTLMPLLEDWVPQQIKFCALHNGRLRLASREAAFLQYLTDTLGTTADPRCRGQNPNLFFALHA